MVRGGPRANSGPAPDPLSFRSARRFATGTLGAGWIVLPAEARSGPAPSWPLTAESPRESELWAALWTKPQAVEWKRLGMQLEVALYVRRLVEAEQPDATAALGGLVVRLADGLGLTIPGLRANRWQIGTTDVAPVAPIRDDGNQLSARERMKILRESAERREGIA